MSAFNPLRARPEFEIGIGLIGWVGTRVIWVGLGLLFLSLANGFFHPIHSVIHMAYVPGMVTGTLLYLPLALLAARHAVGRRDVDGNRLLLAFAMGTAASFMPFIHVWVLHWVG